MSGWCDGFPTIVGAASTSLKETSALHLASQERRDTCASAPLFKVSGLKKIYKEFTGVKIKSTRQFLQTEIHSCKQTFINHALLKTCIIDVLNDLGTWRESLT